MNAPVRFIGLGFAIVAGAALPSSVRAQCSDSVHARTLSDSAPARELGAATTAQTFDRVITLSIDDRTWQRDSLQAGVALGASGVAGTRRAPWRACAGASVSLGRVTASLHNVHGLIRIHADLSALEALKTARNRNP